MNSLWFVWDERIPENVSSCQGKEFKPKRNINNSVNETRMSCNYIRNVTTAVGAVNAEAIWKCPYHSPNK